MFDAFKGNFVYLKVKGLYVIAKAVILKAGMCKNITSAAKYVKDLSTE
jgi:hypothetical protein